MSASDWSAEAREALKSELRNPHIGMDHLVNAVLAALVPHVQPRTDWEWGVRHSQGRNPYRTEQEARQELEMFAARPRRFDVAAPYLIRRRPAGEWEVAE